MPQPLPNQPSGTAVIKVAAVILAVLAAVVGIAIWLVHAWDAEPVPSWPVGDEHRLAAHLETAPQPALDAYLEEKNRLLDGYAWIDRDAAMARIPIQLAVRALAAGAQPFGGPAARKREAARPAAAPYLRQDATRPRAPAGSEAKPASEPDKEMSP